MERQAPPTPERLNSNPLRQFRLNFADRTLETDPRYTQKVENLKGMVAVFNGYSIHVNNFQSKDLANIDSDQLVKDVGGIVDNMSFIYSSYKRLEDSNDGLERAMYLNYLMQMPKNLLGVKKGSEDREEINYPANTQFVDINIENEDQLTGLSANLITLEHDSRNRITGMVGSIDAIKRSNLQPPYLQRIMGIVNQSFTRFAEYLEVNAPLQFQNTYPPENISALDFRGAVDAIAIPMLEANDSMKDVQVEDSLLIVDEHSVNYFSKLKEKLLEKEMEGSQDDQEERKEIIEEIDTITKDFTEKGNISFETPMSSLLMTQLRVICSRALLGEIVENAAGNIPKTYARRDQLSDEKITPDRKNEPKQVRVLYKILPGQIQFITEDRGAGIAEEIEKNGIKEGVSVWEGAATGTGKGLFGQREKIRSKKFNGDIKLESIYDPTIILEEEPVKVGGRNIIVLPLLEPGQTPQSIET